MADPAAFPEANLLLVAPAGQEAVVRPLLVMRGTDGRIVSCWKLSAADLHRIAETGEIWLSVWSGSTAPPVLVTGVKEDVIKMREIAKLPRLERKPLPAAQIQPAPLRPVMMAPERKSIEMERLAFDLEVKLGGDGDAIGTIDGYGSVFGLLDRGGDIVAAGAFKASLADWRRKKAMPPMLWQHDPSMPVGVWTEAIEDEKGLRLKGRLVLDVPQAAAARALIAAGAVKGLSIGYRTIDSDIDRTTGARTLKKVDLWEISLVTFPMLPEAQISAVKSIDPRALEAALRSECGLSSAAAVKAVAIVKQHLRDGGDKPDLAARDGTAGMIMSLRKAAEALR